MAQAKQAIHLVEAAETIRQSQSKARALRGLNTEPAPALMRRMLHWSVARRSNKLGRLRSIAAVFKPPWGQLRRIRVYRSPLETHDVPFLHSHQTPHTSRARRSGICTAAGSTPRRHPTPAACTRSRPVHHRTPSHPLVHAPVRSPQCLNTVMAYRRSRGSPANSRMERTNWMA